MLDCVRENRERERVILGEKVRKGREKVREKMLREGDFQRYAVSEVSGGHQFDCAFVCERFSMCDRENVGAFS